LKGVITDSIYGRRNVGLPFLKWLCVARLANIYWKLFTMLPLAEQRVFDIRDTRLQRSSLFNFEKASLTALAQSPKCILAFCGLNIL